MRAFHQRGVTLISLLIGMVISLLAILACLSMFSDLIRVSGEAKVDAVQDGSLATALLRVQVELQNTGYAMGPDRVVGGVFKDFHREDDGAIAWRYKDGTAAASVDKCQRLESATVNKIFTLKLQTLKTADIGLCATAEKMADITADKWQDEEILSQVTFYDAKEQHVAADSRLVTFTQEATAIACGPYGAGVALVVASGSAAPAPVAPDKHPIIRITKHTAAHANGNDNALFSQVYKVCLVNIVVP